MLNGVRGNWVQTSQIINANGQIIAKWGELIDHIKAEGEKQKITPKDDEELQRTIPYLNLQMKALIARDLWGMDEYFAIFNESSDAVLRALQLIDKKK